MSILTKVAVIVARALLGLLLSGLFLIFVLKDINVFTVFLSVALFPVYWLLQQFYFFSAAFLREDEYYGYLIATSDGVVDEILQYCCYNGNLDEYVFAIIDELTGNPVHAKFLSKKKLKHIYGKKFFLSWDEKKKRAKRHQ